MKTTKVISTLALSTLALLQSISASTVISGDPIAGGIAYAWNVNLAGSDTGNAIGHVGPWSWEDEVFGSDIGWAHESHWIAVSLSEAAELTFVLTSKGDVPDPGQSSGFAGGNLFPGVTIWSGWDNDGTMSHNYFNKGNVSWAEDLTYLGHIPGGASHSIGGSWILPAGQYTFAIGGNDSSVDAPAERQGYDATFSTTPVPEPTSALLAGLGSLPLLFRRKR